MTSYDVLMIRDFFDHLRLSVDMCKTELESGTVSPEVEERVRNYVAKYNCVLVPDYELDTEGLTSEEAEEAGRMFDAFMRETMMLACDVLGTAMGIYVRDALACAENPGEPAVKRVSGRMLLDRTKDGDA